MLDWWLERHVDWPKALQASDRAALKETWALLESQRSPVPFVEQVETTNACSMTCVMCPRGRGQMTRRLAHMKDDVFRAVCVQVEESWRALIGTKRDPKLFPGASPGSGYFEANGLRLHHFGSPLLDPRFIERVAWIKEHCAFPVHASISAEQLRRDAAERLIGAGIDRLVIAIDGTTDAEYKAVRGPAADYDRAVAGIHSLLEAKITLGSPVQLDVQLVDTRGDSTLQGRFEEKWSTIEGLSVLVKRVFEYPDVDGGGEIRGDVWAGPCAWPFLSMVVAVDGRVLLCCADYNAECVVGNVQDESLFEIWHGERYRNARREFLFSPAPSDSLCGRCGFYGRQTC